MRHDHKALLAAAVTLSADVPAERGLGGRVASLAAAHPDRCALVCGRERLSFGDLEVEASRMARALVAEGAHPGSRIAIALPNSTAFIVVAVAAWKVGATPVPLSHHLAAVEREDLLRLADPAVVVDAQSVDALVASAATHSPEPLPDIEAAPWKAIGSGGSTGQPKLIVDPGAGPMRRGMAELFGMRPGGVQLVAGPLYHSGPFSWAVMQLMAGGTVVVLERFDAETYLDTIERERVTWSFVVPTMLHRILGLAAEVLDRHDLDSLEVVLHGAAPCPPWLKRKAIDRFGADRLWEYYGASEVPGSLIRGDEWLEHEPSVGRPLPGLQVSVRDDLGAPLPPGEVGEIWIRPPGGPGFRYEGGEARIDGGFVSVGDLGWLDADGYLFIADRRTDLIITGGANVYPAEVENALLEHPAVVDVAVVGLAHPEWGQVVHAIVQPGDSPVTEDDLAAFSRDRLAAYKLPKSYELVETLPRDPAGKLRRSALRAEREGT